MAIEIKMKKNVCLTVSTLLLLSGLTSCTRADTKFKNSVNSAIEKGENQTINRQLKQIFEEEYGWEKARGEAKQYCQELKEGKKRAEIFADRFKYREKDRSGKKTTAKKGAYLKLIKIIIYDSAEKSYCPQRNWF